MGQPTVQQVWQDPEFIGLDAGEQVKVMQKIDPDFAGLPGDHQMSAVMSLRARGQKSAPLKPPAPNPMGLANQELAKSGISVAPPPNSNLRTAQNMQPAGVLTNMALNAAGMLSGPTAQQRQAQKQRMFRGQIAPEDLPFGTPSSTHDMIAGPAQQIGSGDVSGGLSSVGTIAAQAYLMKKAGERLQAQTPPQPAGGELSKAAASERFGQVSQNAGTIPVDVTDAGKVALRTQELAKSGGSMPKVVRDYLNRITDPSKPPMTYDEARDFYSNATRLSADEFNRLTPVMKRQVGQFTESLGKSIEGAANAGGQGQNYLTAMRQYRAGSQRVAFDKAVTETTKKLITYGLPAGVAGYVGAEIVKRQLK